MTVTVGLSHIDCDDGGPRWLVYNQTDLISAVLTRFHVESTKDRIKGASQKYLPVSLRLPQNQSVRRIPRTPGPGRLLCAPVRADAGAQWTDLQLHILATHNEQPQRLMHTVRSYPGTGSTVANEDSVEEEALLHVTLKQKNIDDLLEFAGVGGGDKGFKSGLNISVWQAD